MDKQHVPTSYMCTWHDIIYKVGACYVMMTSTHTHTHTHTSCIILPLAYIVTWVKSGAYKCFVVGS